MVDCGPDNEISAVKNVKNTATKTYSFSRIKTLAVFKRVVIDVVATFIILLTYNMAFKAGINGGVISVVFSSNVIFTSIIFYFTHG